MNNKMGRKVTIKIAKEHDHLYVMCVSVSAAYSLRSCPMANAKEHAQKGQEGN